MKPFILFAISLAVSAIASGQGSAQSTIPGSGGVLKADNVGLSAATEQVLRTAASSNLFEIESSRLTLSRSQSPKIKEFADRMLGEIQAHSDAIALLSDYARNGNDPKLKSLAAQVLPALQNHLEQARALR